MKPSSVLCASVVALAALALTSVGTSAATNLNTSRSNIYRTINPSDPKAVQACTSGGGKVGKDPNGHDACITTATPTPAPVGAINLNTSRSNIYRTINSSDPKAVQTCTSGGGTIGKDKDGNTVCIRPVGMKGDFSRGTTP